MFIKLSGSVVRAVLQRGDGRSDAWAQHAAMEVQRCGHPQPQDPSQGPRSSLGGSNYSAKFTRPAGIDRGAPWGGIATRRPRKQGSSAFPPPQQGAAQHGVGQLSAARPWWWHAWLWVTGGCTKECLGASWDAY